MASRLAPRIAIITRALARRLTGGRRRKPEDPRRILIAHHLLLGDTLMLTPLVAKLRRNFPAAEITMAVPHATLPLFSGRPYALRALGWNPRDAGSVRRLLQDSDYDLALIPGDNRHAWLAQAMGARWIVAFAGDRPGYKSWWVDELRRYPEVPGAWFDITAMLIDGAPPAPFRADDWPAPAFKPFRTPEAEYCVLHVGASSRLKLWGPDRWQALAAQLRAQALQVVWSAGPGESALVDDCHPHTDDLVTAARLDLAQLWHLLRDTRLLVAPDTGVAHLGRIAGSPTVTLFGPGSAALAGDGEFWRGMPYRALAIEPFPCRDQKVLFKREVDWVRICKRSVAECASPRCMQGLLVPQVLAICNELLRKGSAAG